jgi:hypothetical protein
MKDGRRQLVSPQVGSVFSGAISDRLLLNIVERCNRSGEERNVTRGLRFAPGTDRFLRRKPVSNQVKNALPFRSEQIHGKPSRGVRRRIY